MSANTASHSVVRPSGASTRKTALIADGEGEVLADDAARAAREAQETRQGLEVVAHEGDVGGLERDVGAGGAHGDAQVGGGEGGRVVDAVADHRDQPMAPPQVLDGRDLVGGQEAGADLVDAGLTGDRGGRGGIVAGEQGDVGDAGVAQTGDGVARDVAQWVAYSDDAEGLAAGADGDDGLALGLEAFQRLLEAGVRRAEQRGPADEAVPALDLGAHAQAGDRPKARHGRVFALAVPVRAVPVVGAAVAGVGLVALIVAAVAGLIGARRDDVRAMVRDGGFVLIRFCGRHVVPDRGFVLVRFRGRHDRPREGMLALALAGDRDAQELVR